MRIHSNVLIDGDIIDAAKAARADVTFSNHGSRSHARSFEVHLTGESRRRPNSGKRGAIRSDDYAATWDQWGVFIAHLFERDNEAVFGTVKHPAYANAEDFANQTGDRFGAPVTVVTVNGYEDRFESTGWPEDAHGDHTFRFSGRPREQSCTKCSAVQRRSA